MEIIQMSFIWTSRKAFDTVPHKRLINKLKRYIRKETINWIEAFLTDRKQKVAVNGKESKWPNVTSVNPQGSVIGPLLQGSVIGPLLQGSVIGPLLFVLYINDVTELTKFDTFLFYTLQTTSRYLELL